MRGKEGKRPTATGGGEQTAAVGSGRDGLRRGKRWAQRRDLGACDREGGKQGDVSRSGAG
jgi:hypothetical protein